MSFDENQNKINNAIMNILLTYDEDKIKDILKNHGFTDNMLFSINESEDGKYDVTLGFNTYGEDVCSRELNTHLDAYRFAAVRTILGYDIISY